MKPFCLPPKDVEAFKKALMSNRIDIPELMKMDSAKRTEFLRQYAGDNAPQVNLLFEQKLVLPNKMRGIINWASKVGEIGRYSPEKKAQFEKKMADYKEQQTERMFNPKEDEAFLNDLVDAKLGTHVTREEAQRIFDLSKKADNLKKNYSPDTGWTNYKDKIEYGLAKVLSDKYVEELKDPDLTIRQLTERRVGEFKQDWSENKTKAVGKVALDTVVEVDKNSVAMVASIDNSFIGRQGLKVLLTHPTSWAKSAYKSFGDIYKALKEKHGDEQAKDILHADLVSRDNYMNDYYQQAGILAKFEEQYPTSHPARVPYLGRAFKASEVAFNNSALRMRMETFDLLLDTAKKNGVEINDGLIKDIGQLVNGVTARANIGKANITSLVLWAPRMMWSNVQFLTAHGLGGGLKTSFARKQAALNLFKATTSIAGVAAVINALDPGSVETDPRSTDFMKYKNGNTRIDITGGMGSYITLSSRIMCGLAGLPAVKNSQTGIIKELNKGGIADKTIFDVGLDFLMNKTTPLVREATYIAKGRNFEGNKPTIVSTVADLTLPIPITNFYQNFFGDYKEGEAVAVLGSFLDLFGINANTYQNNAQWNNKNTQEMKDLKDEVGEKEFNRLNIEYNNKVNKAINELVKTKDYQEMTDEEKQNEITALKKEIKEEVIH
ncbi:MAG: hypothetical protein WC332_00550 [Clostridia bacterium]|jgi:hypothetical protein